MRFIVSLFVSLCLFLACTGRLPEPLRQIPEFINEDGRRSFVQIAQRRAVEQSNWYTVLSLGAQAFLRARKIERAAEHSAEASADTEAEANADT